jgi:hypothetical protein
MRALLMSPLLCVVGCNVCLGGAVHRTTVLASCLSLCCEAACHLSVSCLLALVMISEFDLLVHCLCNACKGTSLILTDALPWSWRQLDVGCVLLFVLLVVMAHPAC